jgi:hypothetical protein
LRLSELGIEQNEQHELKGPARQWHACTSTEGVPVQRSLEAEFGTKTDAKQGQGSGAVAQLRVLEAMKDRENAIRGTLRDTKSVPVQRSLEADFGTKTDAKQGQGSGAVGATHSS